MTTDASLPVKKVLSTKEAAAYLSISLPTLFRLTRAGELAHVRIGRSLRFRVEDLDAFLEARVTTKWEDFNPKRKTRTAAPAVAASHSPTPTKGKSPQTRIIGRKERKTP